METTYQIDKSFAIQTSPGEKAARVMNIFGLTSDSLKAHPNRHQAKISIKPGDIVYITGASGAGKSVLFNCLYEQFSMENKIKLDDFHLPDNKSVVDCIGDNMLDTLCKLSKAGLGEVYNMLNRPAVLSLGQQYRFKLACAISENADAIFADEFCSNLDRLTAASVAYKVAKFARQKNITLVLASSHDDIICEIRPDVIVYKYDCLPTQVVYKDDRQFRTENISN